MAVGGAVTGKYVYLLVLVNSFFSFAVFILGVLIPSKIFLFSRFMCVAILLSIYFSTFFAA